MSTSSLANRAKNIYARPVRSILVIKLRAIGDVLISTAVIPNLRAAFPDARIDMLTERMAADIIIGNPDLNDSIIFSPRHDNILSLFFSLRRRRYDMVFDLFCNPRSAQMSFATGAPLRIGYPFRGRAWAYNHHVQSRADRVHNIEFNLDALRSIDIPIIERRMLLPVEEAHRTWASAVTHEARRAPGPLIALNPSGTWQTKRWGLEQFAELADRLVDTLNAEILLVWGPGEESDVRRIATRMRHTPLLPPASTLKQLAAMFECCDFTISNDSGPMHISAAMGTPTLGIFGPTNPLLQGPWHDGSAWVRLEGLACLACNRTSCDIGTVCMRDLAVDAVYASFIHLMEKHHASS